MQYKKSAVPNHQNPPGSPEASELRVLFVDANPDRAQLTLRAMTQYLPGFAGEVVAGIRSASLLASAARYDCVVAHQRLLDDERAVLQSLRSADDYSALPVVVIADRTDCTDAVHAMRAGAADFLAERTLTPERLLGAIRSAVHRSSLDAALAQQNIDLQHENLSLSRKQELLADSQRQLAHTLLTPLTAVSEYISMVLDGVGGNFSNDQGRFLAVARGRCSELQTAIESMVSLSSAEPCGEQAVKSVVLEPLINDVLDQFSLQAALKGIHFGCAIDRQVQCVVADEYELQGILIELLTQMIRACSASGNILVLAEPDVEQAGQVKLILRAQLGPYGNSPADLDPQGDETPQPNARHLPGGLLLETRVDTDLEFAFSLPAALATA